MQRKNARPYTLMQLNTTQIRVCRYPGIYLFSILILELIISTVVDDKKKPFSGTDRILKAVSDEKNGLTKP